MKEGRPIELKRNFGAEAAISRTGAAWGADTFVHLHGHTTSSADANRRTDKGGGYCDAATCCLWRRTIHCRPVFGQ